MPGVGHSQTQAKARLLPGADRKRSRLSRTRQDPWEERSWSNQRWSRATPGPRGTRAGGLALGRVRKSWTCRGVQGRKGLEGGEMPPPMAEPHSVLPFLPKRGDTGPLDSKASCFGWMG